jgi:ABC-type uncharacterized transport system permease subunit
MHQMSVFWLRLAVALYSLGLIATLVSILRRRVEFPSALLNVFFVAVVLHGVSIVEAGVLLQHFPAHTFYESASLCGFLVAIAYLALQWRYQFQGLAVVLVPTVFVLSLLGAMQYPVGQWANRTTRDVWLVVHVVAVLLGYAALIVTAVCSVSYLIQERRLKTKRPMPVLDRLPPLGTLDNLISQSMTIGFALMTVGVVSGSTWAFVEMGTRWIGETRVTIALVTWAVCSLMVFLRLSVGWRGRRAAVMSLVVLLSSAATWAAHVGLRSVFLN